MKKAADALHQEERSGSKGRKWRKNVKAVEKVYFTFDHFCLNSDHIQGLVRLKLVSYLNASFFFTCLQFLKILRWDFSGRNG